MTKFSKNQPVNTDKTVRDYLSSIGIDISKVAVTTQIINDEVTLLEIGKTLTATEKNNITTKYPGLTEQ